MCRRAFIRIRCGCARTHNEIKIHLSRPHERGCAAQRGISHEPVDTHRGGWPLLSQQGLFEPPLQCQNLPLSIPLVGMSGPSSHLEHTLCTLLWRPVTKLQLLSQSLPLWASWGENDELPEKKDLKNTKCKCAKPKHTDGGGNVWSTVGIWA